MVFRRRRLVNPHAEVGLDGGLEGRHSLFQGAYAFVMFIQTASQTLDLFIDAFDEFFISGCGCQPLSGLPSRLSI